MQESEVIVENTIIKSRSKVLEEPQKCLGLVVGNITVYVSLTPTATLSDVSMTNSTLYLPLYLASFVALQDLLLEYGAEATQTVLLLRATKREKGSAHAYHHSSSSIGMMDTTRSTTRQNFLQKGATKVKKMANSVNAGAVSGHSQKKRKKTDRVDIDRPKTWKITIAVDRFQFRVQLSKSLFLSYSLQSLSASVSHKAMLVMLQKHGVDFVRTNSPYNDLLFRCTSLPEITVVLKEGVPLPSASSSSLDAHQPLTSFSVNNPPHDPPRDQDDYHDDYMKGLNLAQHGMEKEPARRERLPSYSTITSGMGGGMGGMGMASMEGGEGSTVKRSIEGKTTKELSSLQVIVEKVEFSLTTRQVNQFRMLSVCYVSLMGEDEDDSQ